MIRRHVAVLAAAGNIGGAERSLLALIAASPEVRFTVLVPEPGDLATAATAAGAGVMVMPWSARLLAFGEINSSYLLFRILAVLPALWRAVRSLRVCIGELRPDVIVTNGIKPHVLGALATGKRREWPLVWYLRDSLEERRVSRLVLRPLSKRCIGAIAISRYIATDSQHYMHRSVSVRVIHNIIDDHQPAVIAEPMKASGTLWFASVGALTPLKGHDLFLRAAAEIANALPQATFVVVGGARYRTERALNYDHHLRRLAAELGIAERTLFLGHREDIPSLLGSIDVLVQSNRGPEGFGRSVAEAMAAGVPVIAVDGWSLSELVEPGRTGWLVPRGDVKALADQMLVVGRDPALRRQVGLQAASAARTRFSAAAAAAAFGDFLNHTIPEHAR